MRRGGAGVAGGSPAAPRRGFGPLTQRLCTRTRSTTRYCIVADRGEPLSRTYRPPRRLLAVPRLSPFSPLVSVSLALLSSVEELVVALSSSVEGARCRRRVCFFSRLSGRDSSRRAADRPTGQLVARGAHARDLAVLCAVNGEGGKRSDEAHLRRNRTLRTSRAGRRGGRRSLIHLLRAAWNSTCTCGRPCGARTAVRTCQEPAGCAGPSRGGEGKVATHAMSKDARMTTPAKPHTTRTVVPPARPAAAPPPSAAAAPPVALAASTVVATPSGKV